jgi:hypothetical protein
MNEQESIADHARFRRYLCGLVGLVATIAIAVFAVNALVDPLWLYSGNRLTGINFGFNEREAKLNRLLQEPEAYDCLIFGSSKTTLLDEDWIEGYRCFNLAFSYGLVGEFLEFAGYAARRGVAPRRLIVGIDAFNFVQDEPLETVPPFVLTDAPPPGPLETYLSIDARRFSLRTLMGRSPLDRYYERDFSPAIVAEVQSLDPDRRVATEWPEFRAANTEWYRALGRIFPGADLVGYIPPISVLEIESIAAQGRLDSYVGAMYALADVFRPLYDFSIPSSVTVRLDNTYDGAHYDLQTNRRVAEALVGGAPSFGVRVDTMSESSYRRLYEQRLDDFRSGRIPGTSPELRHPGGR